jgi:hypothetical protein
MQNMIPSKKAGQYQYGPGLDQIRCYRAVRVKFKARLMISSLTHFLKFIYDKQGADYSINRILAIRNQLAWQQGKAFTVESIKITASKVTVRTSDRLLTFEASGLPWKEFRF